MPADLAGSTCVLADGNIHAPHTGRQTFFSVIHLHQEILCDGSFDGTSAKRKDQAHIKVKGSVGVHFASRAHYLSAAIMYSGHPSYHNIMKKDNILYRQQIQNKHGID